MTAEQIAVTVREAMRAMHVPATMPDYDAHWMRLALIDAKVATAKAAQANSLEASFASAVNAIVALEGAEKQAKIAVAYWARIVAECTDTAEKAREALRAGAAVAEGKHHRATLRANSAKSAEITDEKALPDDCFRVKREPDKALIKARLIRGDVIPGAALVQSPSSLVITSKDR